MAGNNFQVDLLILIICEWDSKGFWILVMTSNIQNLSHNSECTLSLDSPTMDELICVDINAVNDYVFGNLGKMYDQPHEQ